MFSQQKRKWMQIHYRAILEQQFPDFDDHQLDVLSLIVLNAQELLVCGKNFFDDHDDVPDIDHDGHLLESDANCPNNVPPAKSAVETSTSVRPEPSRRP